MTMIADDRRRPSARTAVGLAELVYHGIVRNVRKTHGSAIIGLLLSIAQTGVFVGVFYVMYQLLGMRGAAIRGDFLLYLFSGVYIYMVHTKTMGAVVGSDGPASPMMQHAPMTTTISILSNALAALYTQVLSLVVILYLYHAAFTPITIDDPMGAMAMVLLAWFTGLAVGLVFLAMKPWVPAVSGLLSMVYSRANMIFSGKMFVANTLGSTMLIMFDWNPLFHIIDQTRGYVFLNYNPHYTSIRYPVIVGTVLLVIGMMGEFYTRRHASASWSARH